MFNLLYTGFNVFDKNSGRRDYEGGSGKEAQRQRDWPLSGAWLSEAAQETETTSTLPSGPQNELQRKGVKLISLRSKQRNAQRKGVNKKSPLEPEFQRA